MQDKEAARAESDVCSDLDDDEGLKAALQTDQLSTQDPTDHTDHSEIDTDDDADSKKNPVSQSRKRSLAAHRVLDSDDEEKKWKLQRTISPQNNVKQSVKLMIPWVNKLVFLGLRRQLHAQCLPV